MKTAIFKGNPYHVPNWAKYLAQDGDGSVYAYEKEPLFGSDENVWRSNGSYKWVGNINCIAIV